MPELLTTTKTSGKGQVPIARPIPLQVETRPNSSIVIATIRNINVIQDPDGRVHWQSGAAVDADGANGQNGNKFAYRYPNNDGLDDIRISAGYPRGAWQDILVNDGHGYPLTDGDGNAYSRTTYRWSDRSIAHQAVDATSVPYVVVNPYVRRNAIGVVIGCRALVTYKGKSVEAVVADVSGANDIGEISIAAALAVAIPSSPRTGGVDSEVQFEIWPGTPAVVSAETYELQPA
jgi:Fungal chitosanase of glycosyl hydrolase group 75